MSRPDPLYVRENTKLAWQLDWSVTVFWREPPWSNDWLDALKIATEADGVRILKHRFPTPDSSQFFVSSWPTVRPVEVVRSIKGRLQYLVRERWPKAFQRNYDLHSIGSTKLEKAEAYVASQLEHHLVTGEEKWRLADLQVVRPDVDLSQPRFSANARFWCNLHLVFVNEERRRATCADRLEQVRSMILRAASAKSDLLSRVGLLPDHVHLILGFDPEMAPIDVALRYMNNIAFVYPAFLTPRMTQDGWFASKCCGHQHFTASTEVVL